MGLSLRRRGSTSRVYVFIGDGEMQEGETLEELKARMQAMKPKKPTFTADMLDTANSYDDKVALIRMLVSQESGRVALVLKNMVKS